MSEERHSGFPLFPLGIVALPSEGVPLHIFEDRYKRMIEHCLQGAPGTLDRSFGILWLSDEELKGVGCSCEIEQVLERTEDGRMNILVRGQRPFLLRERQDNLPFPAGVIEFLEDDEPESEQETAHATRELYRELVRQATDREIAQDELDEMSAYRMAATVEFDTDAKQELLELRSETERMRRLATLLESAIERIALLERAQARARSNGKVRFA
jgi:Lon protease-like protein